MAINQYDAIVVGARCAGSPTAMLLARKGYKVLVVDRARFPSDTVSTHLLHPPGVAALRRWGLLELLVATGCPPIDTYAFDFGPFTISGSPGTDEAPVAYAPRRTVLDKLLVDAAAQAGAEIREGFTVESVVVDDSGVVTGIRGHGGDGRTVTERAKVVVGADGRHSLVARAVGPEQYHQQPRLQVSYYSYWSDLPMEGRFETYLPRPRVRGLAHPRRPDPGHPSTPPWPLTRPAATPRCCPCTSSPPSSPPSSPHHSSCSGCWEAMDGFARVIAGVTSPAEFFSEENVRRITLRAGAAAPA